MLVQSQCPPDLRKPRMVLCGSRIGLRWPLPRDATRGIVSMRRHADLLANEFLSVVESLWR